MLAAIKSRQRPVMVYTTDSGIDVLEESLSDHDKCITIRKEKPRNKDKKATIPENLDNMMLWKNPGFPILLIADPAMMRGLNYRSSVGVDQYLCRPFKTDRDSLQAQGRVGRYTDKCTRYRTIKHLVDNNLKSAYLKELHEYVLNLQQ